MWIYFPRIACYIGFGGQILTCRGQQRLLLEEGIQLVKLVVRIHMRVAEKLKSWENWYGGELIREEERV
jgi:hypothetical protein